MADTAVQEVRVASALVGQSDCMVSAHWDVFAAAEWAEPVEGGEEELSLSPQEVVV